MHACRLAPTTGTEKNISPELTKLAHESSPVTAVETWKSPVSSFTATMTARLFHANRGPIGASAPTASNSSKLIFPDEIHDFLLTRLACRYHATRFLSITNSAAEIARRSRGPDSEPHAQTARPSCTFFFALASLRCALLAEERHSPLFVQRLRENAIRSRNHRVEDGVLTEKWREERQSVFTHEATGHSWVCSAKSTLLRRRAPSYREEFSRSISRKLFGNRHKPQQRMFDVAKFRAGNCSAGKIFS